MREFGVRDPGGIGSAPSWLEDVREFQRVNSASLQGQRPSAEAPTVTLEIGVIGQAAAGKSALINALIAPGEQMLPSGGVGPLTGAPARIVYADRPVLRVRYRGKSWLRDVLRRMRSPRSQLSTMELGQLSLACSGDQYLVRDPAWLETAIRFAFHPEVATAPDETAATSAALHRLHRTLAHEESEVSWELGQLQGEFFRILREHTAGQLAPLCETITVGWPSRILREGLTLIDLPGLGTSHDSHVDHTNAWLAECQAVLLVADRAGIPDSVLTAMRRSGFLGRLQQGDGDMIAAVTKLDQVADDARRRDQPPRLWAAYFNDTVRGAETLLRAQLRSLFPAILAGGDVASCIPIRGVSSREHQRLLQQDPEDQPRVQLEESTGIPALRRDLTALARLRSLSWVSRLLDEMRCKNDGGTLYRQLSSLVERE